MLIIIRRFVAKLTKKNQHAKSNTYVLYLIKNIYITFLKKICEYRRTTFNLKTNVSSTPTSESNNNGYIKLFGIIICNMQYIIYIYLSNNTASIGFTTSLLIL